MPSPLGHLIAGAAIAWTAEAFEPLRRRRAASAIRRGTAAAITPLVLACAALAVAPDADILLASHRTYTHSVAAVALAAVASGLAGRALGAPGLATGLACGAAVASHVLLDWLGRDYSSPQGLMAFWPFTAAYQYSGLDLFTDISRRYWKPEEFLLKNALSIARECAILAPLAAGAYWLRRRRLAGTNGTNSRRVLTESRVPSP